MKNKQLKVLKGLFLLVTLLLVAKPVLADEKEDLMKQVGFTYAINHPENQLGDGGALNLLLNPGQEQAVTVTINNRNNQEITVLFSLNGARTNGYGGLEHGPNKFKADKSMAYDLPDLVEIPEELVIPAQSEKELTLNIKMPKVPFEGIVTGGIQMIEKEAASEAAKETGIVNKVAYLFGVTLQMNEKEISPELELQKVYPEQVNFRNAIFLDIANIAPLKIQGLLLDIEVTKAGETEVLYENKKNNMEMAPNTLMAYPVSLGGEKMIAGKYTANILASAHGKDWKWTEDFTITKEDADLFNQKDVNIVQERGMNWQLVVGIVIAIVFVMAGIYFLRSQLGKKAKKKRKLSKRRKK